MAATRICAERAAIDSLISKSFELFVELFPKSKVSIVKLRQLMQANGWYGREALVTELEKSVYKRLLHVGINTHEILKGYAAIVEGLALFDPSFVLVHKVCRKIRDYVKKRPDTMRTIITFITQEKPGDIHTNNSNRLTLMLDEEQLMDINDEYVIMNDDNLDNRWMDWKPDPRDADPKESRLYRESADVFNMLVSVYGSKDLFVKEYQQLLSERLISNGWDKHLQSEFTYLETMKKRFTDGELNSCEVMLRDIKESGKLAKTAALSSLFPISPRVVSSVYWPEISKENQAVLTMNKTVQTAIAQYEKVFSRNKASREISWFSDHGGYVQMELALADSETSVQLEVPLVQAQLLMLFLEKESWNMEEMKESMAMEEGALKPRLQWWCNKGFLVKSGLDEVTLEEVFTLSASSSAIERLAKENKNANEEDVLMSDEEEDVPLETQVEELEQYWAYTKNLLQFSKNLTAARLLSIFKHFDAEKPAPSIDAINLFMQKKLTPGNGHKKDWAVQMQLLPRYERPFRLQAFNYDGVQGRAIRISIRN